MDDHNRQPPPQGSVPANWYAMTLDAARLGPEPREACAKFIVSVLQSLPDAAQRRDAARLVAWLRETPTK